MYLILTEAEAEALHDIVLSYHQSDPDDDTIVLLRYIEVMMKDQKLGSHRKEKGAKP